MDRRSLDFRSFEEVAADVDALAAGPYTRCGNWDLATTCDHLAKTFESGLDNKPVTFPFFIRVVAPIFGPLIFKRVLRTRRFPTGVSAPRTLAPDHTCECAEAVARLKAAMNRASNFQGPLSRHPIFGRATVEQWKDAMMIHCAHHLSFLRPADAANKAAARRA
jgi:hypothetical protein